MRYEHFVRVRNARISGTCTCSMLMKEITCERGRPAKAHWEVYSSTSPEKQGGEDANAGVGLTDSTLSLGKPDTRGSGQQTETLSRET